MSHLIRLVCDRCDGYGNIRVRTQDLLLFHPAQSWMECPQCGGYGWTEEEVTVGYDHFSFAQTRDCLRLTIERLGYNEKWVNEAHALGLGAWRRHLPELVGADDATHARLASHWAYRDGQELIYHLLAAKNRSPIFREPELRAA